jgi:hypothetical protein
MILSQLSVPYLTGAELATIVDRRGTSAENVQKGDSLEDSPSPHQDPALSVKVTSGGLSAPVFRWKAGCHLLWINGSWGLHFLASMLRSLMPPFSGTSRSHSVDWWATQNGPSNSNKTQRSLPVSTSKTVSPQAWGTMKPPTYHKFSKKPRATN